MLDEGIWDERQFRRLDLAHCAAMINADGTPEQVELSADWLAWGTYGDDLYPKLDLASAKLQTDRLQLCMTDTPGTGANALERGLADLWQRTAGPMPERLRAQFRRSVTDMTESWLWELANRAVNRIPDPIDYVEMRRATFGADMTMTLARLADAEVVPPEIYATRTIRELETAAQDYACFTNDLFSYQKEIQFEGELHNMVLVLEQFLDVDRWAAAEIVARLMAERLQQFERLVAVGLPALFAEQDLTLDAQRALTSQAARLKDWMSGILEWHRRCPRYTDAEQRRLHYGFTLFPTGLGTSAARVPAWSGT